MTLVNGFDINLDETSMTKPGTQSTKIKKALKEHIMISPASKAFGALRVGGRINHDKTRNQFDLTPLTMKSGMLSHCKL